MDDQLPPALAEYFHREAAALIPSALPVDRLRKSIARDRRRIATRLAAGTATLVAAAVIGLPALQTKTTTLPATTRLAALQAALPAGAGRLVELRTDSGGGQSFNLVRDGARGGLYFLVLPDAGQSTWAGCEPSADVSCRNQTLADGTLVSLVTSDAGGNHRTYTLQYSRNGIRVVLTVSTDPLVQSTPGAPALPAAPLTFDQMIAIATNHDVLSTAAISTARPSP
jgi:hypothetical protein